MTERKFKLSVPCKEFSIDAYKYLPMDVQIPILVELYRKELTKDEMDDLINHRKYVRLMLYQDGPDTDAYMYAYCRPMDSLNEQHAKYIKEKQYNILGEINYVTTGYFFEINGTLETPVQIEDIELLD